MFPHVRPVAPAADAGKAPKENGVAKSADKRSTPVAVAVPKTPKSVGQPTPAMVIAPAQCGWLLDSGSGYDLVSDNAVKGKDRKRIHGSSESVHLTTANGELRVDRAIELTRRQVPPWRRW